MPRIALVTARAALKLDDDLAPLTRALEAQGADVDMVAWDDDHANWTQFDIAVLRSTWDYTQRLSEFMDWAQRVAAQTTLVNSLDVVRWNTDKHYLSRLAHGGARIVPSWFVEPGDDATAALDVFLAAREMNVVDATEFVVKPCVGAGSRDAQRYAGHERTGATVHIERLLEADRSVLLQPYLDRVDEYGETALIYFDGMFSHAIRKGPLLQRGKGPTRALFAREVISSRIPTRDERQLAEQTLAAIPFVPPLAYARVDLIQDSEQLPCVLELELTEPSLFFSHAPGSAARFARTLLARAAGLR